ncbi:MAG: hypothetical protein Kow0099_14870 [Candidatus Abyssubacteria bacterium]
MNTRNAGRWLVTVAVVLFVALSSNHITRTLLYNESHNLLYAVAREPSELLKIDDMHPPGYYLFMHFWYAVVGRNDVLLRLPSSIFGVLAVVALFSIGKQFFDETVAGGAAVLFAVSPLMIELSTSVRPYSLLTLAFLISLLCFLGILKNNGIGYHAANSATGFVAMCMHYYGVFLPLYQFEYLIHVRKSHRAQVRRWLLLQAVVAALYLPLAYIALTHQLRLVNPYGGAWILTPTEFLKLLYVISPFGHKFFISSDSWLIAVGPIFLAPVIAGLFPFKRNLLLVLYMTVPLVLVAAISNIARLKFYQPYHFIFLVPVYMLFLAAGLKRLGRAGLAAGALVVAVSVGIPLGGPAPDWRECARFLQTHSEPHDAITICCPNLGDALLYYFPEADIIPVEDVLTGEALPNRLWLVIVYEDIYFDAKAKGNMFRQLERLGFFLIHQREEIRNVNLFLCWRPGD